MRSFMLFLIWIALLGIIDALQGIRLQMVAQTECAIPNEIIENEGGTK